ncbi:EthD family reductase [Occultella gossypii]|uniref:EthD family reductase n=1 Tax=Occultella gossypii TaxID=2800820 RepID=A0ABS7S578_9MICO|nr:EthD family reductase [Occultella gossypii]MBZ2195440.1 EthD family reductase [Occultella gossypii]
MYKIIAIIVRKDGLTREEFLRHWQEDHPAFVRRLHGVRRYRQNVAIDHPTPWPADGVAELWFDSLKDIAIAFDRERSAELFAHEAHFIGDLKWLITEEVEVPLDAMDADRPAPHLA